MSFRKKVLTTGLAVGGVLTTLAIYNKMTETLAGELDTVLTGEERRYPWKYGEIFYSVKGASDAKPLLLIHGLGPGASSFEWRKNVDALAQQFRVYALDLLGFGLSDHPATDYSAEIFTDLVYDFTSEVIGKPALVVARGLSCAYVVACAFRRPQSFERLVLVTPSSALLRETIPGPYDSAWKFVLHAPIVGEFLYNVLISRQALYGSYDRHSYHNPGLITDELVEYLYTSAHQPNSRFPLAALMSGALAIDVREPFARLQMPVITVWGRESQLIRSGTSEIFKQINPRVEVRILDRCSDQLQDEQASAFNDLIREFASAAV